jgi:hypothetical protein
MRPTRLTALLTAALLATGCYHQVVETGATRGSRVVERPWTATYIFGLVPAAEISVAAECPNGVAVIETQQSFVNGLVGVLTLGIYTPQTVRITCAGGGAQLPSDARTVRVAAEAPAAERQAAAREAVELATRSGAPVVLELGR